MKKLDPILLLTISDIMVNLSAGWFGAAFIIPVFSKDLLNVSFVALTVDIVFGTLCFAVAYKLRGRRSKRL